MPMLYSASTVFPACRNTAGISTRLTHTAVHYQKLLNRSSSKYIATRKECSVGDRTGVNNWTQDPPTSGKEVENGGNADKPCREGNAPPPNCPFSRTFVQPPWNMQVLEASNAAGTIIEPRTYVQHDPTMLFRGAGEYLRTASNCPFGSDVRTRTSGSSRLLFALARTA